MAMQPVERNARDVSKEQLREDLRQLSQTVEELMNATADDSRENVSRLRARAEERLRETRARLSERGERVRTQTMDTVDCCEHYVRENPWQSLGISAAVGMVAGLLIGRR
ncbi:ElaB/YqjD/DUF883 family membrane-anchored ribosome-binding protein [Kushneria sinocarnis]|uniref:ElaB/YqjD/DUF883 family membrane-anchored ribosome-binding protein n=1 Tax=Kushneria sinocarnis TaxID=595502 RepID=A0A420WTI7_9GAMM|nr:YqjD family protein [Kushneria sinocarnis]RKQ96378.1 ElaB/YqjD/DUF883 family membrane-anchored ribosome-binding protein [Kushneria sinocarnis]